jgi:hypothetical protein
MERKVVDAGVIVAAVAPRLATLTAPHEEAQGVPGAAVGSAANAGGIDVKRETLLRRVLEEWGIRCREQPELVALEGFGIVSERGVEVTVAADLGPAERALAYARSVIRLALLGGPRFATWFQYRTGRAPQHQTFEERRTALVVDALARALLAGRLEAVPRYLLAAASKTPTEGAGAGLLGGCSRALLGGLHRASSALYWRSGSYQALRASAPMVRITGRVHELLSASAGAPAA